MVYLQETLVKNSSYCLRQSVHRVHIYLLFWGLFWCHSFFFFNVQGPLFTCIASIPVVINQNSDKHGFEKQNYSCRVQVTTSRYSVTPTCPVCFGHQPCEAATDFGSRKVIVLKRFYRWSNEGLLNIPDVLNFPHISPSIVFLNTMKQHNAKASHYWNFLENNKRR